ncbi:MAG: hypothetical protein GF344_01070 [Chitinivibrionales bacterium]|nr:hypothetical protein [Chitinivibrionales bacterium]
MNEMAISMKLVYGLMLFIGICVVYPSHGEVEKDGDTTAVGDSAAATIDEELFVRTVTRSSSDRGQKADNRLDGSSFNRGSIVMNVGFLYAASLVGVDWEFGLGKRVGFHAGLGFVGAAAGFNFHIVTEPLGDVYIDLSGEYFPALQAVLPAITINSRVFFGSRRRAGLCAKLGLAFITVDKTLTMGSNRQDYTAGTPMLYYAIGIPIRVN